MDKVLNENEAKTLIERFAEKQQGGHFACPRCGKMTMDAESVTRNALSRKATSLTASRATPCRRERSSSLSQSGTHGISERGLNT